MTADPPDTETRETATDGFSRCDYCRLPIPSTAVTLDRDGETYEFCSAACRDALAESDRVFTHYHGFRHLSTGVSALDTSLPEGIPRNSFVMLLSQPGSRLDAVLTEVAWRALQRNEPVVFVTFLEPPVSVIQSFLSLEWNALPSLENGDLWIVDCFSDRVDDRSRMDERMGTWNTHLREVAAGATTRVSDAEDLSRVESQLDTVLTDSGMQETGIVVIDSLTEIGTLVQPVQAYDFVKDIRADVAKARFVPIFAGATATAEAGGFPQDLGYIVDGIVDLRSNDDVVEGALVKQLRVRKMNGVLTYPEWASFEYTAGEGIVTFDPLAQLEAAEPSPSGDDSGESTDADGPAATDHSE